MSYGRLYHETKTGTSGWALRCGDGPGGVYRWRWFDDDNRRCNDRVDSDGRSDVDFDEYIDDDGRTDDDD